MSVINKKKIKREMQIVHKQKTKTKQKKKNTKNTTTKHTDSRKHNKIVNKPHKKVTTFYIVKLR